MVHGSADWGEILGSERGQVKKGGPSGEVQTNLLAITACGLPLAQNLLDWDCFNPDKTNPGG